MEDDVDHTSHDRFVYRHAVQRSRLVQAGQQLAKLLGRPVARIGLVRKTDASPSRISVIDVATVITGKNPSNTARDVGFVKDPYPEVAQKLSDRISIPK